MCLWKVITLVWPGVLWPLQRDPWKKKKKKKQRAVVGRAKVKLDGHKYLAWFVIIMASWVCLQTSQCGSGDCRMDGAKEWEYRDAQLKTEQPEDDGEGGKKREGKCFKLWCPAEPEPNHNPWTDAVTDHGYKSVPGSLTSLNKSKLTGVWRQQNASASHVFRFCVVSEHDKKSVMCD